MQITDFEGSMKKSVRERGILHVLSFSVSSQVRLHTLRLQFGILKFPPICLGKLPFHECSNLAQGSQLILTKPLRCKVCAHSKQGRSYQDCGTEQEEGSSAEAFAQ